MTKTTPVFILRYGDSVAMKDGSAFASANAHVASDLTSLVNGDGNKNLLYATFEPDSWLLDGRHKFIPDSSTKVGFVSDIISDSNGEFSDTVLLIITLDTTYTFEQLVRFSFSEISGDYCTSLKVEYRNSSNVLIDDQTYNPTTYEYRAELPTKPIANVKYIYVYFYATNRPYRHLRLLDMGFDEILFRGSEIKSATLVEEISRFSTELKSNSLEVSLFSPSGEYSVVSTTGIFSGLEENQPADMYEEIDGVTNYMGRFYLDSFNSPTPNKMNLKLKDAIARMEESEFLGAFYHTNPDYPSYVRTISASDLLNDVMAAAGFEYEIDSGLASIVLDGVLHIGNCRNALQRICFALGAYATCSRSNKILIRTAELSEDIVTPDYELTSSQKSMSQSVVLKPLITSVNLMHNEWGIDYAVFGAGGSIVSSVKTVFNGSLALGNYLIDFAPDIAYSTGALVSPPRTAVIDLIYGTETITGNGVTFLSFECTTSGDWNITINGFFRNKKWSNIVEIGGGVADTNRVTIKEASFITKTNVSDLVNNLFTYYQERYVQNVRLYATTIKPGDSVVVDTYDGKQIQGIVEKVSTNLSGGFISDVEIIGVLL